MTRRFLRRGVLGITALAGVALAGCNGKPTGNLETKAVAAAVIIGPVASCGVGFAHPNICCRTGRA